MDLLGVRSKKTTKTSLDLRSRSCMPNRPAFVLPHRRLPTVSHPPRPLRNVPLRRPRAGGSERTPCRLRTAALPVPDSVRSAAARVIIVVERVAVSYLLIVSRALNMICFEFLPVLLVLNL
jgi:hypothetical protein